MSARAISTPAALLGMLIIAATMAATVNGLYALVNPGEQLASLDAPVPAASPCSEVPIETDPPAMVTATELIECPDVYDGSRVRYRGEVVRGVLHLGDRVVVQVNDDRYGLELGPLPEHRTTVGGNSGIPVVLAQHHADAITHVGDYRHRGDVLEITGTFRAADPDDGGGPTITADTSTIQRAGNVLDHRVDPQRLVVTGLLASVTLAMAAVTLLVKRD